MREIKQDQRERRETSRSSMINQDSLVKKIKECLSKCARRMRGKKNESAEHYYEEKESKNIERRDGRRES